MLSNELLEMAKLFLDELIKWVSFPRGLKKIENLYRELAKPSANAGI